MSVTLLGTGRMGGAIAPRVAGAGHQLRLWDGTRRRSPAEAAR